MVNLAHFVVQPYPQKYITIGLQLSWNLNYKQKRKQLLNPFLMKILNISYFNTLWVHLDMHGHTYQKSGNQFAPLMKLKLHTKMKIMTETITLGMCDNALQRPHNILAYI